MARDVYKANKRRKETARLKKQEEKRQRRFAAKGRGEQDDGETVDTDTGLEGVEAGHEEEGNESEGEGVP